MADLLEELIDAAGCNEIPAPARAPDQPSIVDLFGALKTAAAGFEVAPGVGLAEHFWTHPVALHNGEAAASLLRTARNGHSIHGFAVLYATDVRPPLLYGPNMSPLRVTGTIGTDRDRKRVVKGKSVSVSVNLGGRCMLEQKKKDNQTRQKI